jgi:hypothetical protein
MAQKDVTIEAGKNSIAVTVTIQGPSSYPATSAQISLSPPTGPPTVTGNDTEAVFTFAPLPPGTFFVMGTCSGMMFGNPVTVGSQNEVLRLTLRHA